MSPTTLGQRLRAARLAAGLSQGTLADRCGIPKPRLSRYENDHIVPSLWTLQRLAEAMGVAGSTLLGDSDSTLETFVEAVRAQSLVFDDDEHARAVAAELGMRLARNRRDVG